MSAPATAAAPVGKAPVTGRAWLVTGMLCLFMIINFADKAVLGLVAQPAMAELGLSPGQWGQIGSAFFFLFAISSIFVGALASYVNTRWLIFGMVIVWSAAQLPVFLGGGFMVLLLTRILLGAQCYAIPFYEKLASPLSAPNTTMPASRTARWSAASDPARDRSRPPSSCPKYLGVRGSAPLPRVTTPRARARSGA